MDLVKHPKQDKHEIDAETINNCFSCGICTGGCPTARVNSKYNPRKILHKAVIEDSIGDEVWLCAGCYTCQERCPTKTKVADIINLFRRIKARREGVPEYIKPLITNLQTCGFVAALGDLENKRRERMGLPPMQFNQEIKKIIELTEEKT